MASKLPIVRQTAWLSLLPQLLLIMVFTVIFGFMAKSFIKGLDWASLFYLAAHILLRSLVPRNHRRGNCSVQGW